MITMEMTQHDKIDVGRLHAMLVQSTGKIHVQAVDEMSHHAGPGVNDDRLPAALEQEHVDRNTDPRARVGIHDELTERGSELLQLEERHVPVAVLHSAPDTR